MALLQKKQATLAPNVRKIKDEQDTIHPTLANYERIPPLMSVVRAGCYYCFVVSNEKLMTCKRCRAVKYCSADCQKKDWVKHKAICKVLNRFETGILLQHILAPQLMDAPFDTQEQLDTALEKLLHIQLDIGDHLLKRPLSTAERNLIVLGPRCTACGKSDTILRIEMLLHRTRPKMLKECQLCNLAWGCCDEHWDLVKDRHCYKVAPDGTKSPPDCLLHRVKGFEISYTQMIAREYDGHPNVWFYARIKTEWTSLKGSNWDHEILDDIQQHPMAKHLVKREYTEALSMPFTVLWALENLNRGSITWIIRQTLVIHLVGADQYEFAHAGVFEELLHKIPSVKRLKVYFIGPKMGKLDAGGAKGKETYEELCPHCTAASKKMVYVMWGKTYHDLIRSEGPKFSNPDLAIAFNAGLADDKARENTWARTIKALIDKKIPSAFTAYGGKDGCSDANVLQQAGAKLLDGLGPMKNEWASLQPKTMQWSISKSLASNGWISGIFK